MYQPNSNFGKQLGDRARSRESGLAANRSTPGAYQGGLQTNFTGYGNNPGPAGDTTGATSNDQDVLSLQRLTNEDAQARAGKNEGVDFNANASQENMYRGRIGIKNSLAEQIAQNPDQLMEQENNLKQSAGEALGQGLKGTRENFNRRGLLYSGGRESGENKVKGSVAGSLASGLSGARRESANSLSSAQNAYGSVDLANQQQSLELAHQAFDTANQNNIARLQAMQQLGLGLGSAVGSIAGSRGGSSGGYSSGGSSGGGYSQGLGAKSYDQIMGR